MSGCSHQSGRRRVGKTHLDGATWREGVSQPSLPSREGRRAGVASGAGRAGELPASAERLTEVPGPLTGLGLHKLERRSSSVERRGRHLDIMDGACRQGGSVVPEAATRIRRDTKQLRTR